jgi:TP901 family phage tail tape measure protein
MKGMRGRAGRLHSSLGRIKGSMGSLVGVAGKLAGIMGPIGIAAAVGAATKCFVDFEDAMANVRKTTGMSKEEIKGLGDSIKALALEIPVAATELAGIAAVAGQLGITGKENILSFTEDVAKMTTAFDMSAEEVAIAMAKLSNIYDIPIEKTSNLGSAINVLGNTTAASESQLMAFSMALGPAAQQLGFTATQALSLGASMIAVGMDASNAGTRLNRAFSMIGQNLDEVAGFMGVTVEEFKASFEAMPMETFIGVIEKLSTIEGKLEANTIGSKLFGEIGSKAIKAVVGDIDGLRTNLENSAKGFEENTSLTEEFAAKTDTLKARFTLLKNSVVDLLIDMGGQMAPAITAIVEGIRGIIPQVKEAVLEIGSGFGEMFESVSRQAGPALRPLIEKLRETGKEIRSGLDFKTILDDIGVFIGAGLRPLIQAFSWLIDKLGPLWGLLGQVAGAFHNLANALKTEEGRLDDILDATKAVTDAKRDLFDINEMLASNTKTLAEELESAGAWTAELSRLEEDAKSKADALAEAQKIASEAIATHGAESEIAATAIANVKQAEEDAKTATEKYASVLETSAQILIDTGVATDGLHKAQLEFTDSSEDAIIAQEDLTTAVGDLERELEEAKQAPFDLGEAFAAFDIKITAIFAALPLKVAESIAGVLEAVGDGLEKLKLTPIADGFDAVGAEIRAEIESIRNHLEIDIPAGMKVSEEAVEAAAAAMVEGLETVQKELSDVEKALRESGGSYADAIRTTLKEINELKKAWALAGEEGKKAIQKQILESEALVTVLEAGNAAQEDFFNNTIALASDAAEEVKALEVTVGDTTLEFKDAAAEVLKNADAYKKLHDSAEKLMDIDWSIFLEFKDALPNINEGIGNMSSSFVDLKEILGENIEELEDVKKAVQEISVLAAPFLEEGFLNGIKAIGDFAGALKDAGSAIDAFSGLQDISIDGCINFSLHVRDMVSALQILESQMEDLVPVFGDMDSLITGISDAFLYGGDKMGGFMDSFDSAISRSEGIISGGAENFNEFREIVRKALDAGELTYLADTYITETDLFQKKWKTITVENAEDVGHAMFGWMGGFTDEFETSVGTITSGTEEIYDTYNKATMSLHNWVLETYGLKISQEELYAVMELPPEEQKKWLDDIMHSEAALTFQMNKQTNALKAQTGQLSKITDALRPYLEFMRTLNEIASLSAISSEELNSGLSAINDTLANLGTTLSTINLRPAMESLFGTKITEGDLIGEFTGGTTTGFTKVMEEYQGEFHDLIVYVNRLSFAISDLVTAFDSLGKISESVLLDEEKLKEVFEDISTAMANFTREMGEGGFATAIASGFDKMIVSAKPLVDYFSANNAAITKFNSTLGAVKITITNVISTMAKLKEFMAMMQEMSEAVVVTSGEMEIAFAKIPEMLNELTEYIASDAFGKIVTSLEEMSEEYKIHSKSLEDSLKVFGPAIGTFNTLTGSVSSLNGAFDALKDVTIVSTRDMEKAFSNIDTFITRFTEALHTNIDAIAKALIDLDTEWAIHAKTMEKVMPSYSRATSDITTLLSSITSLGRALLELATMGTITSVQFDKGFGALTESIASFAVSLKNNVGPLVESLSALRAVWVENEEVLVPLMLDFRMITQSFGMMAANANLMSESFKQLAENEGTLEKGFKTLIKFIKDVVENTKEFYTPEAAEELKRFIEDIWTVIRSFQSLDRELAVAVGNVERKIVDSVRDIEKNLLSISHINSSMYVAGTNVMLSLIYGLRHFRWLLIAELKDIAEIIQDYLKVASPAKRGPLQYIEEWPRNIIKTFAEGMHNEMGTLNNAFDLLAAPIPRSGGSGGNRTTVTFHVTQTISDRATADYATQELEKMLKRHEVV